MAPNESEEHADNNDPAGSTRIKIPAQTRAALERLAKRLEPASTGDLITFLARHFEGSSHLTRFIDLRELHALTDRLNTVLLFLATTNLEIGQHLRRIEAGHHRRLVQEADELVLVHNRLLAQKAPHRAAQPR